MQILIGGIGVAIIPLAIAAAPHQEQPVRAAASRSFEVNVWAVGDVRITNIAIITIVVAVALWAAHGAVAPALRNGPRAPLDRRRRRDRRH